ncbi:MAG: PQQ-binding-like beta-propeller repeat protein, partial [Rhodopila sp.]
MDSVIARQTADLSARRVALRLAWLLAALLFAPPRAGGQDWPVYGGDAGGMRYSAATLITRDTVSRLAPAWTFHTGDRWPSGRQGASFEDTPILADGRLLVCTPTDRVIALDPLTGRPIWTYDPELAAGLEPGNSFLCRGVAVWHDATAAPAAVCAARVVLATLDARVIELDLATGEPCDGFGVHGTVRLPIDPAPLYPGELTLDSPPAMLNDTLVIGSSIDDMTRALSPGADVWALDAHTGATRWRFDPDSGPGMTAGGKRLSGGGNVWAPIAVDAERNLVFLPTASPTAAFWGGERPGDDLFSSAIVALEGTTGRMVWRFQTTHHDIWDYD